MEDTSFTTIDGVNGVLVFGLEADSVAVKSEENCLGPVLSGTWTFSTMVGIAVVRIGDRVDIIIKVSIEATDPVDASGAVID